MDSFLRLGTEFVTDDGKWTITNSTTVGASDNTILRYDLEFKGPSIRSLRLFLPKEIFVEGRHQRVLEDVRRWLESPDGNGELRLGF
jgi:hypothetical protein